MTSMMMAATLYQGAIPVDENTVRNTATPYNIDAPAAEAPNAPDRNEIETDSNPDLGMVNRQLGSHTIGMLKYAPPWIPDVNANADANDIINRQVSTSGTAAQREAAGQFGHGTILTTEGIEPVADLVDGGSMTNTYFTANDPEIQSSSGNFMSIAPGQDHTVPALVAGVGKEAARTAAMSSTYNAFYANVAGS